mmetsp:Transcript_8174/g.20111  ORF Transcript_8174/g.20111 Transcript_8174/m.20111 type:complete len:89 (+) Transcript_8174:466-732(+)
MRIVNESTTKTQVIALRRGFSAIMSFSIFRPVNENENESKSPNVSCTTIIINRTRLKLRLPPLEDNLRKEKLISRQRIRLDRLIESLS